jgi:hypothetical protein
MGNCFSGGVSANTTTRADYEMAPAARSSAITAAVTPTRPKPTDSRLAALPERPASPQPREMTPRAANIGGQGMYVQGHHSATSATSASGAQSVSSQEIEKMLSLDNLARLRDSLRKYHLTEFDTLRKGPPGPTFELNGRALPYSEKNAYLGSGGTKEVFQVIINNEPVVMAICGKVDGPAGLASKWRSALNEPANIEQIRRLGILVNDRCEIIPVTVDGCRFPAIVMKPYLSHDFEIHDRKNPYANPKTGFDWLSIDSHGKMVDAFSGIMDDIKTLSMNGINLPYDSVNIAVKKGKLRLFVNDIGAPTLQNKSADSRKIADSLLGKAIEAFFVIPYSTQNGGVSPYMKLASSDTKTIKSLMVNKMFSS